MRPPLFWFVSPGRLAWQSRVRMPFARLAAWMTARRVAKQGYMPKAKVICVGNLNMGGTGKTPTVIAVLQRMSDASVHVVSRGYGGVLIGPVQVDPKVHSAEDVGDEPLLIAAFATVWVAKDRAAGVRAAEAAGAEVVILDDGFQNPSVVKDVSVVVVDAGVGFGNGCVAPAGPLREPVDVGVSRADLVLAIGNADERRQFLAYWNKSLALPVLEGTLEPLRTGMDWTGAKVLAFAGIGRPGKFFATLRDLGADVVQGQALDDHQPLTDALMMRLEAEAKLRGAQLVTTEKDAVRLPASFRQKVVTLPVRLEVEDWTALDELIDDISKLSG